MANITNWTADGRVGSNEDGILLSSLKLLILVINGVINALCSISYNHICQCRWVGYNQGYIVSVRRLVNWEKAALREILNSFIQYNNHKVVTGERWGESAFVSLSLTNPQEFA